MADSTRRLAVLGSTGSIGTQALEVAALYPDRFQIVALTAFRNRERLFEQVRAFRPRLAGLVEPVPLAQLPEDVRFCEWVFGPEALTAAAGADVDDVLVSVVGMAGLESVLTALGKGRRVLLANKEAPFFNACKPPAPTAPAAWRSLARAGRFAPGRRGTSARPRLPRR